MYSSQGSLDTMDKQEGCPLARLPLELTLRITFQLVTPDLGALRRTCKRIEAALSTSFAREFFSKKQFMLSELSLQALVDISKHELYSQSLTHVIIGLDHFELQDAGTRDLSLEQLTEYRAGHAEQQYLMTTSRGQLLLAEAFRNLSNLRTLDIRDFSSNRRSRDGVNCTWHSYGAPTIEKQTGRQLTTSGYPRGDFASKAFALVLAAAVESGAQLPSFEALCRNKTWGLTDFAFYVPPSLEPSYDAFLLGIQRLHLDLYPGLGLDFGRITNPEEYRVATVMLKKFLLKTPNVTSLRLNLQHATHSASQTLFEWIGRPDPDSDKPLFPDLQQLSLGSLEVNPETLLSLFEKFTKLTSVGLRKLVLLDNSAHDVKDNLWQRVIERLSRFDTIKHVHLGFLRQRKLHGAVVDVLLYDPGKADDTSMHAFAESLETNFHGSAMGGKEWLTKSALKVHVQWPKEPEEDDEPDSGDDEDDGDHDGDGDGDGDDGDD